jgi:excinuclease ABC subunit B
MHFDRTNADLAPGMFRAIGRAIEIMPVNERIIYRFEEEEGCIGNIARIDPVSRAVSGGVPHIFLFPAKHFVSDKAAALRAVESIKTELADRLAVLKRQGKVLEHERLKRRTSYDLAMIREIGYCNGIENYSRHFSGKAPGDPPDSLLAYFPKRTDGSPDFLTVIDESHVTVTQIAGMQAGDRSRKDTLVEHGFRLPSAVDNRPLMFSEFEERVGAVVFTSATPGDYERKHSSRVVEQIIRPTGLIDPEVTVRPVVSGGTYAGQVGDFIAETQAAVAKGQRALATTLTKKMAEDLSAFLVGKGIRARYLHSDVLTLDRITTLTELRKGAFDVLVGVNLLREGLDLPEVAIIGILDADKEGFLRSETALIQTIGRAARNVDGRVILYADSVTPSMKKAIDETARRRAIQTAHNTTHHIVPATIHKSVRDITESIVRDREKTVASMVELDTALFGEDVERLIADKRRLMEEAVQELDFETAAILRDEIKLLTGESSARGGAKTRNAKTPRRSRR